MIKFLIPYALLVILVVFGLISARRWALEMLARPEAQRQWTAWREDVANRRDPQAETVQRQTPKSTEPPGLVLMRDHFAACLVAALVLTSVLYGVTAWMIRGAFTAGGSSSRDHT